MFLSYRLKPMGAMLIGCLSVAVLAQDAPVPPNAIAQGSVMLIDSIRAM